MKVWGFGDDMIAQQNAIATICARMDLKWTNGRKDGRAFAFKLDANTSRARYARRSSFLSAKTGEGRRLTAVCYHGWRDFIRALFEAGASRVQTMQGDWRDADAFTEDLYKLASVNIGSMMSPCKFIEACGDNGHDTYGLETRIDPEEQRIAYQEGRA